MVLFSQPGQELAYARMEDLVFEEEQRRYSLICNHSIAGHRPRNPAYSLYRIRDWRSGVSRLVGGALAVKILTVRKQAVIQLRH